MSFPFGPSSSSSETVPPVFTPKFKHVRNAPLPEDSPLIDRKAHIVRAPQTDSPQTPKQTNKKAPASSPFFKTPQEVPLSFQPRIKKMPTPDTLPADYFIEGETSLSAARVMIENMPAQERLNIALALREHGLLTPKIASSLPPRYSRKKTSTFWSRNGVFLMVSMTVIMMFFALSYTQSTAVRETMTFLLNAVEEQALQQMARLTTALVSLASFCAMMWNTLRGFFSPGHAPQGAVGFSPRPSL